MTNQYMNPGGKYKKIKECPDTRKSERLNGNLLYYNTNKYRGNPND